MSPFDFLNSINDTKKNLIREDPEVEKEYNPWLVNKGLSYFPDTVLYANEMNKASGLDKLIQYEFFLYGISKRKRFSKWATPEKESKEVQVLKEYYKCSMRRAEEILSVLTTEQIENIIRIMDKGGRK